MWGKTKNILSEPPKDDPIAGVDYCPKCGVRWKGAYATGNIVVYKKASSQESNTITMEEYLEETCSRCGYTFTRPTYDSIEKE